MLGRLRRRVGRLHPNHHRIGRGALWVGLFVLAAKLCTALREVAIAWRFGISGIVDAYQIAFTVATWLPMVLGSAATAVFVPRLVALARKPEAYRAFVDEANGLVLWTALGVGLLTAAAAWFIVPLLANGLGPEIERRSTLMALQLSGAATFLWLSAYLSTRLQAKERFGYTFLEGLPSLGVALLIVAMPGSEERPLVLGTWLGVVAQAAWLVRLTTRSDGFLGGAVARPLDREWRLLYASLIMMVGGQLLVALTLPIDQAFASSLGEGSVATLGYAARVVGLVTALGTVVLARAVLPVVSSSISEGQIALGARQSLYWAVLMGSLALIGTIVGWLLSPVAVRLLFERGAFDRESTLLVTEALRYGLLQLPPYIAGIVLVQWLSAAGRYPTIMWIAAAGLTAKIASNFLLVDSWGVPGIMIATAIMYAVTAALMLLPILGAIRRTDASGQPASPR